MLGWNVADKKTPEWYVLTSDGEAIQIRIHPDAFNDLSCKEFYERATERRETYCLATFSPLDHVRVGFGGILERISDSRKQWIIFEFRLPVLQPSSANRCAASELAPLIAFCHTLHLLLLFLNARTEPVENDASQRFAIHTAVAALSGDWMGAWAMEVHLSASFCATLEPLFAKKDRRRSLLTRLNRAYEQLLSDTPSESGESEMRFVDVRYHPPKSLVIEVGGASFGIDFGSTDARHQGGLAYGTILTTHNCDHPAYQVLLLAGLGLLTHEETSPPLTP